MKNFIGIMITGLLLAAGSVWAETTGDIDGDGKITLTEAVGALRIVSGSMDAPSTEKTIDMTEYNLGESSFKKIWKQTILYNNNDQVITQIGIMSYEPTELNGEVVMGERYETGLWSEGEETDYIKENLYFGYEYEGQLYLYDPPVTKQMQQWAIGRPIVVATTFKSDRPLRFEYREYELVGEEDITVPAGTFEKCLVKTLKRSLSGRYYVTHIAKGVGTVKSMRMQSDGSGYIMELIDIQKSDGSFVFGGGEVCIMNGAWNLGAGCPEWNEDCVSQGTFAMAFTTGENNENDLVIKGIQNWNWSLAKINMTTSDGITFVPNPDFSWPDNDNDGQPDIPDITLTISNGNVTGTLNAFETVFNFSGDVSCP